jgi:hypothetical protein
MTDAVTKLKGELFVINNAANGAYSNKALQADRHVQIMSDILYNQYGVTSLNDIGTKTIPAVPQHYEKVDTGKKVKVAYSEKAPYGTGYWTKYRYEPVYTSKLVPTKPAYDVIINKLNGKEIPAKFGATGEGEGWTDYSLQPVKQANGTTLFAPAPQWSDSSDWNKIAPILFLGVSLTGVGGLIGSAAGLTGSAAGAFGTAVISTAIQAAAKKVGDVGDILESFAKGFAGDYLGDLVGKEIGGVIDSTFGKSDVANVIKQTVASGTKNTIKSIVMTGDAGDIAKTFASAGVAASIPFILGKVPGFDDLSPGSQQIIADAVEAKLNKQPVTVAIIESAITTSGLITDSVKGLGLSPQQEKLLVSGLSNTATALIQNKPIDQALLSTLTKAGQDSFKELAKSGIDSLKKNLKKGSQEKIKKPEDLSTFVEKSAVELDGLANTISADQKKQSDLQGKLSTIKSQLDPAVSEFDQAQKAQEKATSDYYSLIESGASLGAINNQIDTVNKANERYSVASSALTNKWDKFKDETGEINKELDTLKTTIPKKIEEFNDLKDDLTAAGSNLKEFNDKLNENTKVAFVKTLAPEFDPKEYAELHKTSPQDSYDHWLSSGMSQPVSKSEQNLKDLSDNQGIAEGLSNAANVPASMLDQNVVDNLADAYSDYGDQTPSSFTSKPSAAREWATAAYEAGQKGQKTFQVTGEDGVVYTVNTPPEALAKKTIVKDKATPLPPVYGSWNPPPLSVFELPTGAKFATPEQIYNQRTATMFRNPDGSYVWVQIQSARVRDQKYGISDPEEIKKLDPTAALSTLQSIPANLRPASLTKEPPAVVKYATDLVDQLSKSGDFGIARDVASMVTAGAASVAGTFALVSSLTGVNAKNTAAGGVADVLEQLTDTIRTPESKAKLRELSSDMSKAEGFGGTASAIARNLYENPEVLGMIVSDELLGELFIGGVAGVGAKSAKYASKAFGATKEISSKIAARTGIAIEETSEIFAGAKGNFDSTYDQAYSAAIKSGKTAAEAGELAFKAASYVATTTLLTSSVIGTKNPDTITNLLFNNKKTYSSENFREGLTGIANQAKKSAIAEGREEGVQELAPRTVGDIYIASQLGLGSVDLGKNVAQAGFASLIASNVGGAMGAGVSAVKNIQTNIDILTNPDVAIAVEKAKKISPDDDAGLKKAFTSIADAAKTSGITDPENIAYIANSANSKLAVTPEEVDEMYRAEGAENPTEQVYKSLVGAGVDQEKALEKARAEIDPTYVTRDELQDIAKKFNNFVVPEEVADKYTGAGKEADVLKNAEVEFKALAEASVGVAKAAKVAEDKAAKEAADAKAAADKAVRDAAAKSAKDAADAKAAADKAAKDAAIKAAKDAADAKAAADKAAKDAAAKEAAAKAAAEKAVKDAATKAAKEAADAKAAADKAAKEAAAKEVAAKAAEAKAAKEATDKAAKEAADAKVAAAKAAKEAAAKEAEAKAAADKAVKEANAKAAKEAADKKAAEAKAAKEAADKAAAEKAAAAKAAKEASDKAAKEAADAKAAADKAARDAAAQAAKEAADKKAADAKAATEARVAAAKAASEKAAAEKKAAEEKLAADTQKAKEDLIKNGLPAYKSNISKVIGKTDESLATAIDKIKSTLRPSTSEFKKELAKAYADRDLPPPSDAYIDSLVKFGHLPTYKDLDAKVSSLANDAKARADKKNKVTAKPEVTSDVMVTPIPKVTPTPEVTSDVMVTPIPKVTPTSEVTVTTSPEITVAPEVTVTTSPEITVAPEVTVTTSPEVTVAPEVTVTTSPEITVAPEVTVTTSPEVTVAPEVTVTTSPEITVAPEVTVTTSPEITVAPEVTVTTSPEVTVTTSPEISVTTSPEVTVTTSPEITVTTNPDVTATTEKKVSVDVSPTATLPEVSKPPVTTEKPVASLPETSPPVTTPSVTSPPTTTPSATSPPTTTPSVTSPPATTPSATAPPVTSPRVTSPPGTSPPPTSSKPRISIRPFDIRPPQRPRAGFQFSIPQIAAGAAAATPFLEISPMVIGGKPEYRGILDQFFAKVENNPEPEVKQPEATMPKQQYYEYGEAPSIDDILGTEEPEIEEMGFAKGGLADPFKKLYKSGKMRTDFRQGDAVSGPGDGQSDDIPAMLADGEFVFPADVVAALGNGSTKAGSEQLYKMMHNIRARARKAAPKDLPPKALSPLEYMKRRK